MTSSYFVRGNRPVNGNTLKRLSSVLALLVSTSVLADTAAVTTETPAASSDYSLTFKQLGRVYPMVLRGVESADGVNFDIRADQIVTGARLKLEYSYSPALLEDMSQLNVMVNDEVAASLPLSKEGAGKPQTQIVEIPSHLITEFNRLSLQFIGHYTMSCEDPLHSSLWARVGNTSQLEIQVTPLTTANDLAALPQPFFDRRDARLLNLPIVFGATPDNGTVEAAGVLSSWFGSLASYRGSVFPAQINSLPATGNAVVLVNGSTAQDIGGLSIPAAKGPTLSVVTNPNDANGKILVVSGRDTAELKRAATALVLGRQTLSGESVVIDSLQALPPRKPYDAPYWVPSDRPVKLGELLEAKKFNVAGYNPGDIVVPLNFPPDLSSWQEDGAPLNLKYRYTPQQTSTNSSLTVSLNDRLIEAKQLPSLEKLDKSLLAKIKKEDDSLSRETRMLLPLNSVALQSRLQLRYMFDYIRQGECQDIIIDNMRAGIDPDSTLDLSGYKHFIAMPNLGVFKDSGFPFTRMADLSETAVVLPDNAGAAELSAYLTILGRFGQSTGYPATAVTVTQAAQVASVAGKDLLVLASGDNQPLLKQWANQLPIVANDAQQSFKLSNLSFRLRDWVSPDLEANQRNARMALAFSGEKRSSYLTGFESPLQSGRSVVVISSGTPETLQDVTNAVTGNEDYTQAIQGSLVVVHGKTVEPLLAEELYHVGSLGFFKNLQWQLSRNVLLMMIVSAFGIALLTLLSYVALRARARERVEG
ncbi:cellulose biosynthesis cyclic di-GMP-binding regulatory protein BcsB [Pseudomonas viridiflava]|uniref:cellulose biosynthesis cyclic di-GMP-binding regulatory protein BcsB n=1 Tax=Pseudomonas viridiflava TaxID=33069 RepID=UPI000F054261|nr:cellulose biosynthesis cyclic di-GMP-binding regulatory protein BcsB [Pseudomonas viridiflava]